MANIYQDVKETLYTLTGITLGQNKDIMIDNRLQKLLRDAKFRGSREEMIQEVKKGNYITEFINAFTTNKTHFFRENFHFDDLRDRVLPELLARGGGINMYCSASSTGEEPYSIAITTLNVLESMSSSATVKIEATDIDTNVLNTAKDGIYRVSVTNSDFPNWISLPKYFKRRIEHHHHNDELLLKVKDEVKKFLNFSQMNLMSDKYPFSDNQFDVVFCRNVLIYFSIDDQNKILKKLFRLLKVGGTLYLGHSENPLDLTPYVRRMGHNIFLKLKEYH